MSEILAANADIAVLQRLICWKPSTYRRGESPLEAIRAVVFNVRIQGEMEMDLRPSGRVNASRSLEDQGNEK